MPGRYTLHYLLGEHCEMARVAEGGKMCIRDRLYSFIRLFSYEYNHQTNL